MIKRIAAFLLVISLLACAAPLALAGSGDFADISGHWAESFLRVAIADGIVTGYEDGSVRPDDPIKVSEMITAINRVLLPQAKADISAAQDATEETWYYEDAARAVSLGILDFSGGALDIDRPATRQEIFIMMTEAFGFMQAEPDMTLLDGYLDLAGMSGEGRRAAASLIGRGLVTGFGTDLYPMANIKRAEFLTLLYRAAYYHLGASEVKSGLDNSAACPIDESAASVSLYSVSLDKDLVLTCPARNISLTGVSSAARVLVRSEKLDSLGLNGGTKIAELVLANGSGSVWVSPSYPGGVDKLVAASGGGTVSVSGAVGAVEVTGENRQVTVSGQGVQTVAVSGSGSTVTVSGATALKSIVIAECAENVKLIINGSRVPEVVVKGKNASVSGSGSVASVTAQGSAKGLDLTVKYDEFSDLVDHGLEGVSVSLTGPETVPAGGKMTVQGEITGVNVEKTVKLEWVENGTSICNVDYVLKQGALVYRAPEIKWSRNMAGSFTVGLRLTYGGETLYEEFTSAVENYGTEYWDDYDARLYERQQAAIAAVSCNYSGNFTLDYALSGDYDEETKVNFVCGKGYSSKTEYLIWVNRAYQHVNIFEGAKGEWKLVRQAVCGTGSMYSQTPVGVYTTTYKQVGWFTSGYTVKPIVRFCYGSGFAFHSRLYYPGTSRLSDARIGFPVSHGCIRMYDEDVQWIYDYIPAGTTVVVY